MSPSSSTGDLRVWLTEPLSSEVAKSVRRLAAANDVRYVAIMPDVHLAKDVCVGTVVATSHLIYPAAIGSDIGCGMAAVRFDVDAQLLQSERKAAEVLAGLGQRVPTNRHSASTAPAAIPDDLLSSQLSDVRLEKLKRRDGRVQFGTLGRGNHFVEFQVDQESRLWLMVHCGSRAMGQAIASHHETQHGAISNGLVCLDTNSEAGIAYLKDAAWAVRYAEQNRLAVVKAVAGLLHDQFDIDIDWSTFTDSDHNHVRHEEHAGEWLWIHRKGAQSSRRDEPGIIPGSMGTPSFHVSGRGCDKAFCSSSHGAGRKMSRSQARDAISARQLRRQLASVWFDHRRSTTLCEEAPGAYKDIRAVMRAQRELTRITRELNPLLCYKGS